MPVEDVFSITGRGTVATGRVERAGAVNVRVMAVGSLILYVSGGNGDTTLSFFGSLIDLIESNLLAQAVLQRAGNKPHGATVSQSFA